MRTHPALYPLGLQERVKPGGLYYTPSLVVVFLILQSFVQAFKDECPEARSRAEIAYILCNMGRVMVIWLYYTWSIKLNK